MCTNILTFNVVVLKYNPTVLYQPPSKLLKEKKHIVKILNLRASHAYKFSRRGVAGPSAIVLQPPG